MSHPDEWIVLPGVYRARNDAEVAMAGPAIGSFFGLVGILVGAVVAIAFAIVRYRVQEKPQINVLRSAFRIKTREFAFAEIRAARLIPANSNADFDSNLPDPDWDTLTLFLDLAPRWTIAVHLVEDGRAVVAPATRDALLEVIERSSIEIPRDRYDPKGKFARSGSPTHVTKEEAVELVLNPPQPNGKLPVIWPY